MPTPTDDPPPEEGPEPEEVAGEERTAAANIIEPTVSIPQWGEPKPSSAPSAGTLPPKHWWQFWRQSR